MEHFGLIDYPAYLLGTALIILLPGPNSLYVLALAAQQGRIRGWAAAAGVLVGDSVLMTLTAAGAVTVLRTYPTIFVIIKIAGGLYLSYIAIRLLIGSWQTWLTHKTKGKKQNFAKSVTPSKAFKKALLVSLLNPKAILFFLSFFVQFVDINYSTPALPFFILAITLQLFSIFYLGILIFIGEKLANVFHNRHKTNAISLAVVGLAFLCFAVKLIFTETQ